MKILPAILAKSEADFANKVAHIAPLGLTVHVDVMDGQFTPESSWAPPDRVPKLLGDLPFEAHLMVSDPEHQVPVWLAAGASRVYFHAEATEREGLIYRSYPNATARIGMAINPDTPVQRLVLELDRLHTVLVMGVTPGWSGQPLQEITVEKVAILRSLKPTLDIVLDGGVNPDNCVRLAEAGADGLCAGSALTDSPYPAQALERFAQNLATIGINLEKLESPKL
jgi:ribulose-phosphate 3-epimerase